MEKQYYYYFDCLDGIIGDRYFAAEEVRELIRKHSGITGEVTEKHIKKVAANYEATLYRYELADNGEMTNETCLYDPWDM